MKTFNIYSFVYLFLIFILLLGSCKKDDKKNETIVGEMNLAGEMMTLSAIAYTADGMSNQTIKDSIRHYLNDKSLATKGEWKLSWGPGTSQDSSNLLYVVENKSLNPEAYAIVIRGTNVNSVYDILEDLNVFKMAIFTYGKSDDSVAKGAMDGFNNLIKAKDDSTGTTIESYLTSLSTSGKVPLYVTGHSQGGGLAPMMAYWVLTKNEYKEKFECVTYAFAGPGWFNKSFVDNFHDELKEGFHFKMMVNGLDMIPYGYSNLPGINSRNIPVHVPLIYRVLIGVVDSILVSERLRYYNVAVADTIGFIPITSSAPGGIVPSDTISWYNHWLKVEHSHNNYLRLLGAKPIN